MVISGGQTGVDRAAWDAALELGLPIGGWVPRGRIAEDGAIPARYGALPETDSPDPAARTELNVRDSDATLVLHRGPPTGGTLLTVQLARRLDRPLLAVDLAETATEVAAARIRAWLAALHPRRLNVAGPRASGDPGICGLASSVLTTALAPPAEDHPSMKP